MTKGLKIEEQDYTNKTQELVAQRDTHRTIMADPTNKHKNKLINILRNIKAQGGLGDFMCKRSYQTGTAPTQIHNKDALLGQISNRGAVTYGMAKELANTIRLLVRHSQHHIMNTQTFVDQVKAITQRKGVHYIL